MKLATILIPSYLPRPYPGATPTPYQSGTVDKFARELVELSPFVVEHSVSKRLSADPAGRFAHQQIITEYDFMWDPATDALGKAVALTLKSFGLASVDVKFDGEVALLDAAAASELETGLHPWCEG